MDQVHMKYNYIFRNCEHSSVDRIGSGEGGAAVEVNTNRYESRLQDYK